MICILPHHFRVKSISFFLENSWINSVPWKAAISVLIASFEILDVGPFSSKVQYSISMKDEHPNMQIIYFRVLVETLQCLIVRWSTSIYRSRTRVESFHVSVKETTVIKSTRSLGVCGFDYPLKRDSVQSDKGPVARREGKRTSSPSSSSSSPAKYVVEIVVRGRRIHFRVVESRETAVDQQGCGGELRQTVMRVNSSRKSITCKMHILLQLWIADCCFWITWKTAQNL